MRQAWALHPPLPRGKGGGSPLLFSQKNHVFHTQPTFTNYSHFCFTWFHPRGKVDTVQRIINFFSSSAKRSEGPDPGPPDHASFFHLFLCFFSFFFLPRHDNISKQSQLRNMTFCCEAVVIVAEMSTATHAQQVHKTNKKLKASWVLQTVFYMFWFLLLFVGQLSMEEKGAFFSNIDFFQNQRPREGFQCQKCVCVSKSFKKVFCCFELSVSRVENKVWRGGGIEHPGLRTE